MKDENSKEAYIMGTLVKTEYISENNQLISDKNSKVIYWEKADIQDDYMANKNIEVKWLDDKRVQIQDKILSINREVYDYRRD